MAKVNMRETEYYMSGDHKNNILKARELATLSAQRKLQARIDNYNLNPTTCKQCNISLSYKLRKNKFCSKSCAGKFNSVGRVHSTKTKTKISLSSTGKKKSKNKKSHLIPFVNICYMTCSMCNKLVVLKGRKPYRTTCSRECQTHASVGNRTYTNGRRLNIYYYNKHEQKEVLLESSWEHEIAKWLDQLNIVWIRPKPIKWFDNDTNKTRLYYPDFYLPEKNLYLDPKNPTALALSLNKMNIVEKLIPLVYGNVEHIKEVVSNPELESGTHVPKTCMSPSTPVRGCLLLIV